MTFSMRISSGTWRHLIYLAIQPAAGDPVGKIRTQHAPGHFGMENYFSSISQVGEPMPTLLWFELVDQQIQRVGFLLRGSVNAKTCQDHLIYLGSCRHHRITFPGCRAPWWRLHRCWPQNTSDQVSKWWFQGFRVSLDLYNKQIK